MRTGRIRRSLTKALETLSHAFASPRSSFTVLPSDNRLDKDAMSAAQSREYC